MESESTKQSVQSIFDPPSSLCELIEAHFYCLPSQSNLYGLTSITFPDSQNKILVASLRGKIVCVEYQKERGVFRPSAKEVHFTYIPGDAEIIGIDAFSRSSPTNGLVVGITFIKDAGNNPTQFLNIYSPWEPGSEYNLESIAQGCFNMELDFIPYHLYHTDIFCNGSWETVFLVSGSDQQVHVFKEDKLLAMHRFVEIPFEDFFPEFKDLPSNVVWIDVKNIGNKKRLTAVGCENGFLRISIQDQKDLKVVKFCSGQHDGVISCVKVFGCHSNEQTPPYLPTSEENRNAEHDLEEDYNVLITSAVEPTVVYRNIFENGLRQQYILKDSEKYDGVLCACLGDVDWDGNLEILLGTYGQELLVYKYIKAEKSPTTTTASEEEVEYTAAAMATNEVEDGEYKLIWQRSFAHPVLAMQYIDVTNDGLKELVLVSMKGLHILQHDLEKAKDRCMERLKLLCLDKRDDTG
ncbi:KICSTOR complex protein kaptin-like [Glandiceps talaboti]